MTWTNTNMMMFKFIEQLKQVVEEQINPLDKSNDMSKMFDKNRNAINNITTLQRYPQKIKTGGVQGIHERDHSEI